MKFVFNMALDTPCLAAHPQPILFGGQQFAPATRSNSCQEVQLVAQDSETMQLSSFLFLGQLKIDGISGTADN